jgi:hypothetical protein
MRYDTFTTFNLYHSYTTPTIYLFFLKKLVIGYVRVRPTCRKTDQIISLKKTIKKSNLNILRLKIYRAAHDRQYSICMNDH